MRIIYVARHTQHNSNDDEGAITYALSRLGHDVLCLPEESGVDALKFNADFVLFHKWNDLKTLEELTIPKVFWYFDLVHYPDPTLDHRNLSRLQWMSDIIPRVDLGFCTDGDWVEQDRTNKLVCLRQGADERYLNFSKLQEPSIYLLFTGIAKGGGEGRYRFVKAMQAKYRDRFHHVTGAYQEELAGLISRSRIVVAPDHPITDRYWSNRVYMALGYGAFMLHPAAKELEKDYTDGVELMYYNDLRDLHEKIDWFANRQSERDLIRSNAFRRTVQEHTYRHRCATLVQTVKERLL